MIEYHPSTKFYIVCHESGIRQSHILYPIIYYIFLFKSESIQSKRHSFDVYYWSTTSDGVHPWIRRLTFQIYLKLTKYYYSLYQKHFLNLYNQTYLEITGLFRDHSNAAMLVPVQSHVITNNPSIYRQFFW